MTSTHRKKPDAANTARAISTGATAYQAEFPEIAHPSRRRLNAHGHQHMAGGSIVAETTEEAHARPALEHRQRTDPEIRQGATGPPPGPVPLEENRV